MVFDLKFSIETIKQEFPQTHSKTHRQQQLQIHPLQVMNLDRLDQTQFQTPDGFFDYVEGITVDSQKWICHLSKSRTLWDRFRSKTRYTSRY